MEDAWLLSPATACHRLLLCSRHAAVAATPLLRLGPGRLHAEPGAHPCCRSSPAAVYIDGAVTKTFSSRLVDPTGWWSAAPGASAQAPFDQPFSMIL